MSGEDQVRVTCASVGCGRAYTTSRAAFWAQGCACPACGSSKARLHEDDQA